MDDNIITREDLEQTPFIDRHFLFYHGALRRDTVLEYFAHSKFYDRTSCNEELRMQGAKDIRVEHLIGMKGAQYIVDQVTESPSGQMIFIVKKLLRLDRQKIQVLDLYYVLNGMIYQAPTVWSVLNSRLRRAVFALNQAQQMIQKHTHFSLGEGDTYRLSYDDRASDEGLADIRPLIGAKRQR